jgi:MFS family permease
LGDLFGYRRLFLAGMAAFTLASVLCGLPGTPGQLAAARVIQGLTAAAMVPLVTGLGLVGVIAALTALLPRPGRLQTRC